MVEEKKNRTVIGIGMTVQGDIYTKINTDGHMITYRRGFGLFRCLIGNRIIGINNLLFDRLFHNIKKRISTCNNKIFLKTMNFY